MIRSRLRRSGVATSLLLAALVASSTVCAESGTAGVAKPANDPEPPAAGASKATDAAAARGSKAEDKAAARAEAEKRKAEIEKRRHGEPSKAPDGTLLAWDDVHGVWIAVKLEETYFVEGVFYRHRDGVWYRSAKADGPYELIGGSHVPKAARARHGEPKGAVTAKLPDGIDAVYDPKIKVHKITGHKGVFLHDGTFWRYDSGVWYASAKVEGPWRITSALGLPQVLRRAIPPPEKGRKATLPTGEVLVSEGEAHVFAVEGKPNVVFYDGSFYERRSGKWFRSEGSSNNFEEVTSQKIPQVVRQQYHVDKPKKKNDSEAAKADTGEGRGAVRAERDKGAKSTKPTKEAKPARETRAAQPAD